MITESYSRINQELKVQLSVVIPVYNQAKNVSASIARIKSVLESIGMGYEIVVVNDGSLDNTLEILRREEKQDPHVQLVTYAQNKGKGYAVKTGIMHTHGDTVLFTDGDLDISPNMIVDYVKQLGQSDLVIASKRHPQSKVKAPKSRKFLSRVFNIVARILTGIPVKDTQAGLKAGNGPALRAIFKLIFVKRYAFDVELLTIASILKMQIKEMPVEINLDRTFKVKDIIKMFVDVLAIAYRYRIKRTYQRHMAEVNLYK